MAAKKKSFPKKGSGSPAKKAARAARNKQVKDFFKSLSKKKK